MRINIIILKIFTKFNSVVLYIKMVNQLFLFLTVIPAFFSVTLLFKTYEIYINKRVLFFNLKSKYKQ